MGTAIDPNKWYLCVCRPGEEIGTVLPAGYDTESDADEACREVPYATVIKGAMLQTNPD